MELGLIIKNIVIIAAILGTAFLGQQLFSKSNNTDYVYSESINGLGKNLKNTASWLQNSASLKIVDVVSGEVAKTIPSIASAEQAIETQKNNLIQSSLYNAKKFIAQEILYALGITPQDLATCPAK
jgi:hypothetical protein